MARHDVRKSKAKSARSRQGQRQQQSGGDTKRRWTRDEEKALKQLARQNTPTRVIGEKLGRTEYSVRSKASELSISLRPSGRSHYS